MTMSLVIMTQMGKRMTNTFWKLIFYRLNFKNADWIWWHLFPSWRSVELVYHFLLMIIFCSTKLILNWEFKIPVVFTAKTSKQWYRNGNKSRQLILEQTFRTNDLFKKLDHKHFYSNTENEMHKAIDIYLQYSIWVSASN